MAIQNLQQLSATDFSPLESAFKYIYENHIPPKQALQVIQSDPQLRILLIPGSEQELVFRSIISHIDDEESLPDNIFFKNMEDVYLNIHARYMPIYKHKNQFFNLQYVLSGVLNEYVADQKLTLYKGDICFIAPETEHALSVFDDHTIVVNILIKRETFQSVFINLLNQEDIISDFFNRVLLCNSYYPYIYCRTEIEQELTAIIVEMISEANSQKRFKNRLLVNKLEELFIRLLEKHEYDFVTGSTLGETDKRILPVLRYIQEHFQTVTLTETARFFNYSESYLSRLITQYAGSSFSQIVITARMRNAARLLKSTDLSIDEISNACGYEDRSHFHKTFRKHYKMTPAQYRNMQEKSGEHTVSGRQ